MGKLALQVYAQGPKGFVYEPVSLLYFLSYNFKVSNEKLQIAAEHYCTRFLY